MGGVRRGEPELRGPLAAVLGTGGSYPESQGRGIMKRKVMQTLGAGRTG